MAELIQDILYIIITSAGVLLVRELMDFISAKVDEVQTNKEIKNNELMNQYIDMVQQVVYDVVLSVSQTYVDSLKGSKSFNEEAQKQAKDMAITTAKTLMSYETKKVISEVYGDVDLYLSNLIESIVKQTKSQNK